MSKKKKKPTHRPNTRTTSPAEPKPKVLAVTVDGLDLTVDGAALDDVELFDMLDSWDDSDPAAGLRMVPKILRGLFGDAQFEKVMGHLRDPETRRVSFERAAEFLGEALGAINPNS